MKGRREHVGLCLVYAMAPEWSVRSDMFPGIDVNLALLHEMFSSVVELLSLAAKCSHAMC